jgi:hypothetical protein
MRQVRLGSGAMKLLVVEDDPLIQSSLREIMLQCPCDLEITGYSGSLATLKVV